MKSIIKNLSLGLVAGLAIAGLSACQDDIDTPRLIDEVPVATMKPNSTILEVKELFWEDTMPYCKEIGTKENGDHYIVKGRVISNDMPGNVFKSLYIQDETAALPLSINQYNLYLSYRVGQEVVIDLTGLHIGRYAGLEQMGYPQWSARDNAYQPTFMQPGILEGHIELNGLPEPAKIDTLLVTSISDLNTNATTPEYLRKMQGQLVRVDSVKFIPQDGLDVLGIYHENVSQKIQDASGSQLTVRTSGYSNFWNTPLPDENGDIVGILGYYYSNTDPANSWQITLIDKEGMMNFGNPTLPLGSKERPYTVAEAVKAETQGTAPTGWVEGYIVGTIAPEVENITSSSQIEWGADATLASSVVIGATKDTRDLNECLVMELPQNSVMRAYVALANHPDNLGKKLMVLGRLDKYMGTFGVTGNTGTADEFVLEGVEIIVGGLDETFDGSTSLPSGWKSVLVAGNKNWYVATFSNNNYASMTGYKGTAPFDSWLVSPAVDLSKVSSKTLSFTSQVNGYGSTTSTIEVFVLSSDDPATATKTKLPAAWPAAPASGYSSWLSSGSLDLSAFSGTVYIGFRYAATEDSNYATWCIDNVAIPAK